MNAQIEMLRALRDQREADARDAARYRSCRYAALAAKSDPIIDAIGKAEFDEWHEVQAQDLVLDGLVTVGGAVIDDPFHEGDAVDGLAYAVQGQAWTYRAKALLVMNKPAGHECSQKPKHHPSVMSLLPLPLRVRGLQPVGRLDEDTTGLLLLTAGHVLDDAVIGKIMDFEKSMGLHLMVDVEPAAP